MRPEKQVIVDEIKGLLAGKAMFILTDHTGLSANKVNELRSVLKKSGSEYMVVKNRLLKRALDESAAGMLSGSLDGPTAIAVTAADYTSLSKTLVEFAKKNEAPKVKAAFFQGEVLSAAQVGAIASLPSREVLISRFMGTLQGPIGGFVRVLAELPRRIVYIIDQVSRKGTA